MFEEMKYLIHLEQNTNTTYYLFHKIQKILLPIEVKGRNYNKLQDGNYAGHIPPTTLKTIVMSLEGKITAIKIYLYLDGVYYCYINIEKGSKVLEINSSVLEALELAITLKTPILVEKNVLNECGYKITKKILEKALMA